ncbi:MAG: RimK family alpha-L-glutamate ligase [Isosphaeraceae bacterium]
MRPQVVTLVSGMGWHVQDLLRAAARLRIDLEAVPFHLLCARITSGTQSLHGDGRPLDELDGLLVRMMPPGSLEQVVFRMDALHRLEAAGIPVLNPPRAVETAVDKYLSLSRLESAGVPVPRSVATETASAALLAFEQLGSDVVIKPLFGSEGRGILRVDQGEVARRVFQALERIGSVIYLQEVIAHPGYDLRAFVLDGRVVAAMRRHAPEGEWRTNVALGGRPEPCQLSKMQESMALDAAQAVGAIMAGVDLLEEKASGRTYVIEVNAVPGWHALSRTTGCDIASEILNTLLGTRR